MAGYVLACFAAAVWLVPVAHAQVVKSFGFDEDGVLPSAQADVEFFTTTGKPESSIFAVSGGMLRQTIPGTEGASTYSWPDVGQTQGTLDSSRAVWMETRMRLTSAMGIGAFVQVLDGARRYQIMFQAGSVVVLTAGGSSGFPIDTSQFRTYTIRSWGDSPVMWVYVDGEPRLSVTAPVTSLNGFAWGDGFFPMTNSGDADWDWLEVGQDPACRADCEDDGDLDIFDYLCFLNRFVDKDPYADFEGDGDWDIFDFLAFQGAFSLGC